MRTVHDGRVVVEVVLGQYETYEDMTRALYVAETESLNALFPFHGTDWVLSGLGQREAAEVQAKHDRIAKAAKRDFCLLTWDREVEYLQ